VQSRTQSGGTVAGDDDLESLAPQTLTEDSAARSRSVDQQNAWHV
jgi:hypothetical protein